MKKFLLLLILAGCGNLENHPPVIKSKSFRTSAGFALPDGKCTYWYNTCPRCTYQAFEESCLMYNIGDTISSMRKKVVYECPVIVIARDSEGRILINRNIGYILGTNYQVGDTIK